MKLEVRSVKHECVKCGNCEVGCEVHCVECELWSVECDVESVKCECEVCGEWS